MLTYGCGILTGMLLMFAGAWLHVWAVERKNDIERAHKRALRAANRHRTIVKSR